MTDLSSVDFKDNVRFIARRDLKSLGVKAPKNKTKTQTLPEYNKEGVFGVYLNKVPSINVGEDFYCSVPKFLVDATKLLRQHLTAEGLFRKSGSIQRQKVLKKRIEDGQGIKDAQPHDVASLLKQFFRQLPEPLLTNILHDSFLKTQRLENEEQRSQAILLLCLMLPLAHLHTLQFIMRFIAEVATHSDQSKMGTSNLAIVLAPNLMHNSKKEGNTSEKYLKDQTAIIDTLLKNAHDIGMVPGGIYERAKLIGEDGVDGLTSSGDELEENSSRNRSKRSSRARTASISGFVSGLGQRLKSNSKTPVQRQHRRSKSVKADLMRNKHKYQMEVVIPKAKDDAELENFAACSSQRMSLRAYNKRKPLEHDAFAMSPASKRRALLRDLNNDTVIGKPQLVSTSAHILASSLKPITPTRPVADMVKSTHSNMVMSATSKVKVVDVSTYVPSPENGPDPSSRASPSVSTRSKGSVESPLTGTAPKARGKSRNTQPRRNARRNSSGATRCFHSSPKFRQAAPTSSGQRLAKNTPDKTDPDTPDILPQESMDVTHVSVAAEVEPMATNDSCQSAKALSRVIYTRPDPKRTPCKHHADTPPMPATLNTAFKAHFTEI